jgi:hypothetical protein
VQKYGGAREAELINIIRHMCIAFWITRYGTHSEYVVLINFPWQQWLREGAQMLCYTYIVCLVCRATLNVMVEVSDNDK